MLLLIYTFEYLDQAIDIVARGTFQLDVVHPNFDTVKLSRTVRTDYFLLLDLGQPIEIWWSLYFISSFLRTYITFRILINNLESVFIESASEEGLLCFLVGHAKLVHFISLGSSPDYLKLISALAAWTLALDNLILDELLPFRAVLDDWTDHSAGG